MSAVGTATCVLEAVLLGAATLSIAGMGLAEPDPAKRRFYVLVGAATGVLAVAAGAAGLGVGVGTATVGGVERDVWWGRHLAWILAAPAVGIALGLIAAADDAVLVALAGLLAGAMGLPVVGVGGTVASTVLGGVLLAGALGLLGVRLAPRASERHVELGELFDGLALLSGGVWVVHLLGLLVGPAGLAVLPALPSAFLSLVLDVAGTALVGFFLLRSRALLDLAATVPPPEAQDTRPE